MLLNRNILALLKESVMQQNKCLQEVSPGSGPRPVLAQTVPLLPLSVHPVNDGGRQARSI